MINYVKRAREITRDGGIKCLVSYSVTLLKKIYFEKKETKYLERKTAKIKQMGGLMGDYGFTYWWRLEDFNEIVSQDNRDFWGMKKDFQYQISFPDRYDSMFSFIKDYFWMRLNPKDHVAEIACASGETVFGTAKYVEWVDGYEYSEFMVKKAREKAEQLGIKNVSFDQFDVTKQELNKSYDAITVLGLFTCIFDDKVVEGALKNVKDCLKLGGYLLLKDSYHEEGDRWDPVYCYNFNSGYQAIYRSKRAFFKLMREVGFTMEKEAYLAHRGEDDPFEYCSVISLWRK